MAVPGCPAFPSGLSNEIGALALALSRLLDRVGEGPLNLAVSVCDAQEVQELKQRVAELQDELERTKVRLNRAEYLHRCEVIINAELCDICRQHGIKVRPSMFDRPRE